MENESTMSDTVRQQLNELQQSLMPKSKMAKVEKGPNGENSYVCLLCLEKHTDKKKMEQHLCMHNKEYRFLCGICGAGLKRKEHLDRHMLGHQELRPYPCDVCGKAFKRKEHRNIHSKTHSGDKKEVCLLCHRSFHRKDHLRKHMHTHNKEFTAHNIYPMGDEESLSEFLTRQLATEEHENDMDNDGLSILPDIKVEVVECNEPMMNEEMINDEQSSSELTPIKKKKSYECRVCNKIFKKKSNWRIHTRQHTEKEYICPECGQVFWSSAQLSSHMSDHVQTMMHRSNIDMTNVIIPDNVYDIEQENDEAEGMSRSIQESANSMYQTNGSYDGMYYANDAYDGMHHTNDGSDSVNNHEVGMQHVKQEAKWTSALPVEAELNTEDRIAHNTTSLISLTKPERPHECPICHKMFKRKQHLKIHANVHSKVAPGYWCPMCTQIFPTSFDQKSHECTAVNVLITNSSAEEVQTRNTPQEAKKENKYPTNTQMNGEDIFPQLIIDETRDVPTAQRVFVCKHCSKCFKRKDHYKIHLNIHTGERPFACLACGKTFYRKDHMQKHMQVHVKEKLKPKKQLPDLYPINAIPKRNTSDIKPEITIHAPVNAKLRVPLKIKVPYQMVVSMDNGEQRSVTVNPQNSSKDMETNSS